MKPARDDILRSLRRLLAANLSLLPRGSQGQQTWTIDIDESITPRADYPARLTGGTPLITNARSTRTFEPQQVSMPVTVNLWPPAEEDERAARTLAEGIAGELGDVLLNGPADVALLADGREANGPLRLAVYDYSATRDGQPGPAVPFCVAKITQTLPRVTQDATDPHRYAIAADVTIVWQTLGATPIQGPVITAIPGTFHEAPLPVIPLPAEHLGGYDVDGRLLIPKHGNAVTGE